MKRYTRRTFTPIRFLEIDGKLRCLRGYEPEQAARKVFISENVIQLACGHTVTVFANGGESHCDCIAGVFTIPKGGRA